MKTLRTLLLIIACCTLGGCGLLAVPYRVTIPRRPLQNVRVVDQDTMQPLADAEVLCQTYNYKNWYTSAEWDCSTPEDPMRIHVIDYYDQKVVTSQAKALGDGDFVIAPKRKIGWIQIFFPLPLPTGWLAYRSHDCRVIASASGHDTVWLSNPYAWRRTHWHGRTQDLDPDDYFSVEKSGVTIMLPKKTTSGAIRHIDKPPPAEWRKNENPCPLRTHSPCESDRSMI